MVAGLEVRQGRQGSSEWFWDSVGAVFIPARTSHGELCRAAYELRIQIFPESVLSVWLGTGGD
jgi:hypothetical protein